MHMLNIPLRRLGLSAGTLLLVSACAGSGSAGWTYAPLGPTAAPTSSAAPSTAPSSSPGLVLEVITNDDAPLVFVPNVLEAPPATVVQVNYNNNSSLPHNINFFDGPDQTAPSLGATDVVTGPNNSQSVTFTTPAETGDFYFWCDVHAAAMAGTLQIR
jgi:plastocyanin